MTIKPTEDDLWINSGTTRHICKSPAYFVKSDVSRGETGYLWEITTTVMY